MRRVFRLGFGRSLAREVDDELAFHIDMRTRQLVAKGLTAEQAHREALRQFGDMTSVRQDCLTMDQQRERASQRANLFADLRQDVVFSLRTLRRNPAFTALVVLTLAIGIGANTAIFTLIDAVLLRTLPVPEATQLVAIGVPTRVNSLSTGGPRTDLLSYPLYRDLRDHVTTLRGVLASGRVGRFDVTSGSGSGVERPRARYVSANYFQVLGVSAAFGRVFDGTEDKAVGAAPVVTISHGYWTRRFDADPNVVGQTIVANGVRLTIIGVAPDYFTGEVVGQSPDVWLPLGMQPVLEPMRPYVDDRNTSFLLALGRLAPGATLAQATAEVTALIRRSIADNSGGNAEAMETSRTGSVVVGSGAKGFSRVRVRFMAPLLTLMSGVGVLLLIICANIGSLLLARAIARAREMSVRLALGAGRWRIVRQLLTECAVLSILSAGAGLVIAWWGSHLLLALSGNGAVPIVVKLDGRVLGFTLALSLATVGLFGLIPALRASRVNLASSIRASAGAIAGASRGRGGARVPLGGLLIAGQVALSLVLLVATALLVRSLHALEQADTGLDRDRLLIVDVDVGARGYAGDRLIALGEEMTAALQRIPGVAGVAYSENGLFSGTESSGSFQVPGFVARTPNDTTAYYDQIGPGYFRAIGAHLLEGREFSARDDRHGAPSVIVNETMARFYFPRSSAIGKTIRIDSAFAPQIIGVVRDVMDHDLHRSLERRFYLSYHRIGQKEQASLRFEVRASGDPAPLTNAVRRTVRSIDPLLPIDDVSPLRALMQQTVTEERMVVRIASGFGVLALLLAAIGLYGVMTYAITRRTAEIGLRVALGAEARDVVRLVMLDAFRLVGSGLVVGVPLAFAATRLLEAQLHGTSAADPSAFLVAGTILVSSAAIAAFLPARRASRVAPLVALRQE